MSYEAEQDMQDGADGGTDGSENADDLTMALSGGEHSFVSETKQPLSKGTMAVAGLLVACAAVTYFMYIRNGPSEAAASPQQAEAEAVFKAFINGPDRAGEWKRLIENTEKVVLQFKRSENIPQVPLKQLAGNPFKKDKDQPDENNAAAKAKLELERLKTAAKEAVNDLKLQTIIHRDPKKATCMINNSMYRKGNKIAGGEGKVTFTVDEIRSDAVTVSVPVAGEEPLKFELKMKH